MTQGSPLRTGWARVEIDHLAYLKQRQHRREVLAALRRVQRKSRISEVQVWHERDGNCCQLQPWVETARRIQESLGRDGVTSAWVFAPPEERS